MMLLVLVLALIQVSYQSGVCDEKLLLLELKQDIEDNGILDCLRVIQAPHNYMEDWKEKNKRLAAQWDTDCSFEADYDWQRSLQNVVGINNLVDDTGDIVENDFDDQADMCEIIRAGLAAGKFSEITSEMNQIPLKILDFIDCPGQPTQSEICAVTGGSLLQNDTWYILMDGLAINADEEPHFVFASKESDLFKMSEFEANAIKKVEEALDTGEPISDITATLAQNKDTVDSVLNSLTSNSESSYVPKDEDRVRTVSIAKPLQWANLASTGSDWGVVSGMVMNHISEEQFTGLVWYTVEGNFKSMDSANIAMKLTCDEIEQLDTRSIQGNSETFSLKGAFVQRFDDGFHQIQLNYQTKGDAETVSPSDSLSNNLNLQILEIDPVHKFYKFINAKQFVIHPSDKFEDLHVRITLEVEEDKRKYLAFYQFSGETNGKIAFRLKADEEDIENSLVTSTGSKYANMFGLGVVELESGDHDIYLQSISKKEVDVNPIYNPWQSLSLSVIELPESAKYYQVAQEKALKLQPGSWERFGSLSVNFNTKYNKQIFISYSYSGNTGGDVPIMFKVLVDEVELKTARSQTSNTNSLTNAGGLGAIKVQPGSHTVTVMFKQESSGAILFEKFDIYQSASLTVVEFDEDPSENDTE